MRVEMAAISDKLVLEGGDLEKTKAVRRQVSGASCPPRVHTPRKNHSRSLARGVTQDLQSLNDTSAVTGALDNLTMGGCGKK